MPANVTNPDVGSGSVTGIGGTNGVRIDARQIISSPFGPANANPFLSQAMYFSTQLANAAVDLNPPVINVGFVDNPDQPIFLSIEKPDLDEISWNAPGLPSEFLDNLEIENLLPEPFDLSPPDLVIGPEPTADLGLLPDAPPVNMVFDDPVLDLHLPSAPALMQINIHPFDGVTMPDLPDDVSEFTVVAPSIREYIPGAEYASGLLTGLRAELERRITQGGTMLNPDVENAIWDRGREREARTMRDQQDDLNRMEQMGFALPPGVWLDARLKIATENAAANMGLSREVMIKQAELELEGVKQALEIAQNVENMAMQQANNIEQRAFEASRYATEAGISIYNAKVNAYSAYLEAYRSKVAIYEAQVRGELSKVEIYKAELQAEQTKAEINGARVQQFRILTDAALSAVEVYKAEIAGIQSKAEIERLKVQIFGEQVRAYGSRVNAFTANVEAFKAGVQAQVAKQDAFRSMVQVYGTRVDAGSKMVDARIAEFSARLQAKETEWRGYTARAQTEAERVRSIAAKNTAVAQMYGAEAGAVSSFNDVIGKQWTATTQASINSTRISLEQARANAELFMTQRSLVMEAAKVGATVSAQLGAAALSANSFSTSFNNSRGVSANASYSYSDSTSRSRSYSEVRSLSV